MVNRYVMSFAVMALAFAAADAASPSIELGPVTRMTQAGTDVFGSSNGLLWTHVDPTNPHRLMTCGLVYTSGDSSVATGYVLLSEDDGRTWRETLRDRAGQWVSEESCDFGATGIAYYGASLIPRGKQKSQPMFHLFTSSDGARTWNRTYVHHDIYLDWTYLTAVAGAQPGKDKIVVLNNRLRPYNDSAPNALVLGDSSGRDSKIVPEQTLKARHNFLISDSLVLPDGNIIFSGRGTKRSEGAISREGSLLGTGIAMPDVLTFSPATNVLQYRSSLQEHSVHSNPIPALGGSWPSLAQDTSSGPQSGRLYAAWTTLDSKQLGTGAASTLWFASSTDAGRSWSRKPFLASPDIWSAQSCQNKSIFTEVKIKVNQNGRIGMLWVQNGNTLLFASSDDGGQTFTAPLLVQQYPVAPLSASETYFLDRVQDGREDILEAYRVGGWPEAPNLHPETAPLGISVFLRQPQINLLALAVGNGGVFHAVWPSPERSLFTRTIAVGQSQMASLPLKDSYPSTACAVMDAPAASRAPAAAIELQPPVGTREVTRSLSIESSSMTYHFDSANNTLKLEFALINKGKKPLQEPLILALSDRQSDFGTPVPVNAVREISGRPVWYVGSPKQKTKIPAGATSSRVQLLFSCPDCAMPNSWVYGIGNYISGRLRVFAGTEPL